MFVQPDDPRLQEPERPKAAPVQYAGQWVAWNEDRTEVIAHGTVAEVRTAAIAKGQPLALIEKVPRRDATFVGSL